MIKQECDCVYFYLMFLPDFAATVRGLQGAGGGVVDDEWYSCSGGSASAITH